MTATTAGPSVIESTDPRNLDAERGILTQVDGIGAIDEVTDRVMQAIKAAQAA